jgi:hypothetical protein
MKLLNARPQFKGKPKSSPLDTCEPYLLLKQTIAAGKMKPMEARGLELTEPDAKQLKVKSVRHAGRMVRDHLNRWLKRSGLSTDYWVEWRTMANGNQYAGVVHEPANVVPAEQRRKRRGRAAS